MKPLLELSEARIFFAGTLSEPQLNHPEGIAVATDGAVGAAAQRVRSTASSRTGRHRTSRDDRRIFTRDGL